MCSEVFLQKIFSMIFWDGFKLMIWIWKWNICVSALMRTADKPSQCACDVVRCCSGAICDDTSPPFIVRCMAGVRTSCNTASIHSQLPEVTRTYHSPSPGVGAGVRSPQPGNKLLSCTAAYRSCWTCFWRMGGPPVYKHDRLRWLRNVKLEIWMIWSIVSFVWNTVLLITKVWSSEMAGCGCWCSCLCSRPAPLRPSIVADPFVMPIQTPAPPGSPCQCTN